MAEVIDTLEIAHELRQAGVPEPQADVIARQFKRRYEADRQELVTRQYLDIALQHQSADLEKKIEAVRTELKADIALSGPTSPDLSGTSSSSSAGSLLSPSPSSAPWASSSSRV